MNLRYCETGNRAGRPLVFIHGGGMNYHSWEKQLKYFSGFHCFAPDLPGHGESKDLPFTTVKDCAVHVQRLVLEKLLGEKVHIVGDSFGAQVVTEFLKGTSKNYWIKIGIYKNNNLC